MIPPLLVVGLWPIVVFVLFARLKPSQALIASILGGYLLLPIDRGFNLKGFPLIDKSILPALSAAVATAVVAAGAMRLDPQHVRPGWWPRSRLAVALILLLIVGSIGTVVTNSDPLQYGPKTLSGLGLHLTIPYTFSMLLPLLPFLMARRFLAHPDMHRMLLAAFVVGGLIYTLPALYEIRMSPQINLRIYGFFQHNWNQMVRDGGFRPIVFLQHPLWVGIFLSATILSALALYRTGRSDPSSGRYLAAAAWLMITLVLAKTMGALAITVLLAPMVLFARVRLQFVLAAAIAGCVLFYPALRGAGLIPVERVVAMVQDIKPGRAASLQTRLDNEDELLAKAAERPLFGWSTWAGRNRIYNEDSGRNTSITDGRWIITIGGRGWIGYIAEFGLLTGAILILALRARQFEVEGITGCLALIMAGNLIDLIPNGTLTPITWLMAGALFGRLELGRIQQTAAVEADPMPAGGRYTRFSPALERSSATPLGTPTDGPVYARNRMTLTQQKGRTR